MNIWLLTIGEPIPLMEGAEDRLYRTGYLAQFLADHGHGMTWWTSTFDHFRKVHHFQEDTSIRLNERLDIHLLRACGYSSNLSLRRILDHRIIASKFSRQSEKVRPPDVIVSAFPAIELSLAAVTYGRKHGVPVVLDMRDMWPDIFLDHVPRSLRKITALALSPMFTAAKRALAGATAITGITETFVEWGLNKAMRGRTEMDRAFPMGYVSNPPRLEKLRAAEVYWDARGISTDHHDFIACFFGTLGRQLDLETVIRAGKRLQELGKRITFVICGTGDRFDFFRGLGSEVPNIIFPGWVDAAQIYVLMRRSVVGLDPLPDRYDFLATINNKAIEYLSAGLSVISSPERGELRDLLKKHDCGMSYPHGHPEKLANLLLKLYEDRTTLRRMSKNAKILFKDRFTAEKVYGEMMNYLIKIAEMHKK